MQEAVEEQAQSEMAAPGPPEDQGERGASRSLGKEELLRAVTEVRGFFAQLDSAIRQAWEGEEPGEDLQVMLAAHREQSGKAESVFDNAVLVLALLRYLLGHLRQEQVVFHLPKPAAPLPREEKEQWRELSRVLEGLNGVAEGQMAGVYKQAMESGLLAHGRGHLLLPAIVTLFKSILRQDWEDLGLVMNHINMLSASRRSHELTNQVGRLIRSIYNGLNEISRLVPMDVLSQTTHEIPDAVETLNSIITELENLANRNMDLLEELNAAAHEERKQLDTASEILRECAQECARLAEANPDAAEALDEVRQSLEEMMPGQLSALGADIDFTQERYMTLLANQSYQDLTGQTLKKVIDFIETLQYQLIQVIVKASGGSPALTVQPQEHQPGELAGPDATNRMSQERVDNLLAELGF